MSRESEVSLGSLIRRYGGRHKGAIALGALLLLATNGLGLLIPWQTRAAIDLLGKGPVGEAFQTAIIVLFAAAVGQALVRILSRWVLFGIGRSVEADIRSELFRFFLRQEPAFFQKQSIGDLVSQLANDIGTIRMLFGFALLNIFNTIFAFSLSLGMMLVISPKLTLYALAPFPFLFWILKRFSSRLHGVFLAVQNQLGALSGFLLEFVSGLEIVQNFGAGAAFKRAFDSRNDAYYEANIELAKVRGLMMPIIVLITGTGSLVVLGFGGREVIGGQITLGSFVAFEGYLAMLVWPTMVFGWLFNIVQRGRASLQRISATMGAEMSLPPQKEQTWQSYHLQVENLVAVQEGEGRRRGFTIGPVSFTAAEGQWLGLTGPTGSGKSILLRAVLGFVPLSEGRVYLGDREVTPQVLRSFRDRVAYVPTQPLLFSGSIRDNLAVVGEDLEDRRLMDALEIAGLADDVRGFGRGLDTTVGERGVTLSGGQRQRLGLARALLLERPILILDDCLSAVDAETEQQILERLRTSYAGTVFLATHRVSQLAGCDLILVLDHGRIVERGTHEELLAAGGMYGKLHTRQHLEELLEIA